MKVESSQLLLIPRIFTCELCSVMGSVLARHAGGRGSIPDEIFVFLLLFFFFFLLTWERLLGHIQNSRSCDGRNSGDK